MKIRFFSLCCFCLFFLASCEESTQPQTLSLSEGPIFDLDFSEHILRLGVESNAGWQISGNTSWCKPDKTRGEGNDSLIILVQPNVSSTPRTVTMVVQNLHVHLPIRVNQGGNSEEYHYKLPVIFHVLYDNVQDLNQNIHTDTLRRLLAICNEYYQNVNNSVDMNLEFIPATTDPEGITLSEPGVERLLWQGSTVMDCNEFMKNADYADLIWNPNEYINVVVYTFSNENVLGISHLPFTISENKLAGLSTQGDYYLDVTKYPRNYPHCVSLNNKYINTLNQLGKKEGAITLAHELGHYLGLYHVFDERESGCDDTDYCEDTPSYNRKDYEISLSEAQELYWEEVVFRTACDGSRFVSYNLMDYEFSYQNQFTLNQRERVRHVLQYSPLIPGPKIRTKSQSRIVITEEPEAQTME